jgi:hypothetical protein
MRFDRLWLRLWVPAAFAGTLVVLKWIVWGLDPGSIVLFGLIVVLYVARLLAWQSEHDPF